MELGAAANSHGQVCRALELYREALDICDEHSGALYHMGVLTFEQGRTEDAVQLYERAVRSCPTHFEVLPCDFVISETSVR